MKVCLVSAGTATDFEDPDDARSPSVRSAAQEPHLGVLSLAAVIEGIGLSPDVVDLNRTYYDYLDDTPAGGLEEFAGWAARRITMSRADVYGLSSICNSYPVTIRIAQQIRRLAPSATIMLGGPQASVVDRETLSAFGFVDFVLRGEAEESLPRFLEELQGNRNFGVVGGLTYRSPFGVNRASEATVIEDLDTIPLPAFHLLGGLRGVTRAHVELGRGCPFACNFCSTNDFFRRKFRVKSPQRMLRDMRQIAATY